MNGMNGTVRERIARGLGAGAFGQAVTIVIQLVSVPLFLRYWGIERYGEWLILTAIPSYLALSDLGFGNVAANDMTMATAAGDTERRLITYHSTCALLGVVFLVLAVLVPAIALAVSQTPALGIRHLQQSDVFWVIAVLGGGVAVSQTAGLISAVFRCEGRYATGTILFNVLRLAEFLGSAAALAAGAQAVTLAVAMVVIRTIGAALIHGYALRFAPWSRISVRHAHASRVRTLTVPALSFLAFPIGNAINLQGFALLVGSLLGTSTLVVFSTMRTVCRVASQAMNLINNAIWPEMSRAFGGAELSIARSLHRRACQASLILGGAAVVVLGFAGPDLVHLWTHGKVQVDDTAYRFLLAGVAINALWLTSSVVSMSANRHQRLAAIYAGVSITGLLLATPLARLYGIAGAASATVLIEIGMALFVLPISLSATDDRWTSFCKSLMRAPNYLGWRTGNSS